MAGFFCLLCAAVVLHEVPVVATASGRCASGSFGRTEGATVALETDSQDSGGACDFDSQAQQLACAARFATFSQFGDANSAFAASGCPLPSRFRTELHQVLAQVVTQMQGAAITPYLLDSNLLGDPRLACAVPWATEVRLGFDLARAGALAGLQQQQQQQAAALTGGVLEWARRESGGYRVRVAKVRFFYSEGFQPLDSPVSVELVPLSPLDGLEHLSRSTVFDGLALARPAAAAGEGGAFLGPVYACSEDDPLCVARKVADARHLCCAHSKGGESCGGAVGELRVVRATWYSLREPAKATDCTALVRAKLTAAGLLLKKGTDLVHWLGEPAQFHEKELCLVYEKCGVQRSVRGSETDGRLGAEIALT
jgi:hypothetical protein